MSSSDDEKYKAIMLGLGFDGEYPHKYITRGENFYLMGGSEKTHEHMIDNVTKFNARLKKYGKRMEDLSQEEYYRIIEEIGANRKQWLFYNSTFM